MSVNLNQSITLSWLNTLGGWDYFTLTANKSFGFNVTGESQIEKSGFNDWDTGFISGDALIEDLRIKASETITVRSQDVTADQVAALARIPFSRKVYDYTDPDKPVAVIVNKRSLKYYTDRDKRKVIEFELTYPPIYSQTG